MRMKEAASAVRFSHHRILFDSIRCLFDHFSLRMASQTIEQASQSAQASAERVEASEAEMSEEEQLAMALAMSLGEEEEAEEAVRISEVPSAPAQSSVALASPSSVVDSSVRSSNVSVSDICTSPSAAASEAPMPPLVQGSDEDDAPSRRAPRSASLAISSASSDASPSIPDVPASASASAAPQVNEHTVSALLRAMAEMSSNSALPIPSVAASAAPHVVHSAPAHRIDPFAASDDDAELAAALAMSMGEVVPATATAAAVQPARWSCEVCTYANAIATQVRLLWDIFFHFAANLYIFSHHHTAHSALSVIMRADMRNVRHSERSRARAATCRANQTRTK